MKKNIQNISKLLLPVFIFNFNSLQASENYSCAEDNYLYKQCNFEIPKIDHGKTSLVSVKNGIFNGNALVLCNNGKRTIISESCDYIQGAEDSCKGVPQNTWTGIDNAMCNHTEKAISIPNGDDYKISSVTNSGFVKYQCIDTELKVVSSLCEVPQTNTMTTASSGSQCLSMSFTSNAEYDYVKKSYISIAPNDVFCINEGFDYLSSYVDISTSNDLQTLKKGKFNAVCCSNDTLDSPNIETVVTPITNDTATITGALSGDLNELTGLASNTPSTLKVLNNMCKPYGYSTVESFTASNIVVGGYTYQDEFSVEVLCSGNTNIANNNTECKGAFLSSGENAQIVAKSLGIPFMCDSSTGVTECYKNTCTPFVAEAALCAECDLGSFGFTANANRCVVDFSPILTGHDKIQKFYNDTHSGYADVSCNNGEESVDDARCFNNCLDKRVTWTNKKKTAVCYSDLPNSKYRHYLQPTDNDRSNTYLSVGDKTGRVKTVINTGLAEFHCDDGVWEQNSEDLTTPVCFASCSDKTAQWGSGYSKDGRDKTNACKAPLAAADHYQTPNFNSGFGIDPMLNAVEAPVSNIISITSNTGSANFRCNDGVWDVSGAQECNLSCLPQTVSWTVNGATASASVGATAHNQQLLNIKAVGENTGAGTLDRSNSSVADFRCDDGLYVQLPTSTVYKDCAAGSLNGDSSNYNNVCGFTWNTLRHGDNGKLNASGVGSGTADYVCDNGQMKLSNIDCNKNCSSENIEWGRTSGAGAICPSGYTKTDGMCSKTTITTPTCDSGFTYNTTQNQCLQNNSGISSYDAIPECKTPYADYQEDGYTCEKNYSKMPTCPADYYFNGTECVLEASKIDTGTWVCPTGYTYYDKYTVKGVTSTSNNYSGIGCDACPFGATDIPMDSKLPNGTQISYCNADTSLYNVTSSTWNEGELSYITDGQGKAVCLIFNNGSKNTGGKTAWTIKSKVTNTPDKNYTNVCVTNPALKQTPNCATGYVYDTATKMCKTNSLTAPEISCSTNGVTFRMVSPNAITSYTNNLYIKSACEREAIEGKCCLGSESNCSSKADELKGICDWVIEPMDAKCPTGSNYNSTLKKCEIVSLKSPTCNTGYTLNNGACEKFEVIDATKQCSDNTFGVCNSKPTTPATCGVITLDDGTLGTTTQQGSTCLYNHRKTNAAVATCPSGGSPTGKVCFTNDQKIDVKTPNCSGGILNTTTDKCIKTVTTPVTIIEPVICSANTSTMAHLGTNNLIDSMPDGATGTAALTCNDGKWVVGDNTCNKDCSSVIAGDIWNTNDNLNSQHLAYGKANCQTSNVTVFDYKHGATNKQNSSSSSITTGEVSYQCNDGNWDITNAYCVRKSCGELATGLSWTASTTCNVPSPTNMKWGDVASFDQPTGYSGDKNAEFTCSSNGTMQLTSNGDCNKDCNIDSNTNYYLWNQSVSGCTTSNSQYLKGGESITVESTNATGVRGEVLLSCNNGVINNLGMSCKRVTPINTNVTWSGWSGGFCSAKTSSELYNGAGIGVRKCETVTNTANGYEGTAEVCATDTSYSVLPISCNAIAPPIDCVGTWYEQSTCSVTACGSTGTKGRIYSISRPAMNGGKSCSNKSGDTDFNGSACSTAACAPTYDCSAIYGGRLFQGYIGDTIINEEAPVKVCPQNGADLVFRVCQSTGWVETSRRCP